jgi:hypothetical protein
VIGRYGAYLGVPIDVMREWLADSTSEELNAWAPLVQLPAWEGRGASARRIDIFNAIMSRIDVFLSVIGTTDWSDLYEPASLYTAIANPETTISGMLHEWESDVPVARLWSQVF